MEETGSSDPNSQITPEKNAARSEESSEEYIDNKGKNISQQKTTKKSSNPLFSTKKNSLE